MGKGAGVPDRKKKPAARTGARQRSTKETSIAVEWSLDGTGRAEVDTGLPFLDHMLSLVAAHGRFDLGVKAQGDLEIDGHHTVEDIGLAMGQALALALGDKAGVARFGWAYVPMDEALARAVIDLSGRPFLAFRVELAQDRAGEFEAYLVREFFQALVNESKATLHLDSWHGISAHHTIEGLFKAFARALSQAAAIVPGQKEIPSTKGVL